MIAPGFSNDRVPIHLRLYLSMAISLLITPSVNADLSSFTVTHNFLVLLPLILHEIFLGFVFGFLSRIFIFAIETLMTTYCYTIGLSNIFDTGFLEAEATPILSAFIVLAAIQLVFIFDLHQVFISGINDSYDLAPITASIHLSTVIEELTKVLSQSYLLILRISSPFLLFAITINLSFAFLAKLSPNIPIYFVSGPCVILLGLYIFNILSADFMSSLIISYKDLILRG